jgi:acyl transferase domain-containing protein
LRADGVDVVVAQGDVASEDDLVRVLGDLKKPLRGVIHSAGILDDGILAQQNWSRFESVLAPKVTGAWNLHRLTQTASLDFFVMFSSVASVLGSPGQGNHAAANAFLDGLAHYRRSLGLPALSINWGAWGGIGAAAGSETTRRMLARGVQSIDPRSGVHAFRHLLRRDHAQAAVMAIDWPKHLASYTSGRVPAFLTNFAGAAKQAPVEAKPRQRFRDRLAAAAADQRLTLLREYARGEVARLLGWPPQNVADERVGLQQMGIDSLMSVELRNRMQVELAPPSPLSPTLAFDHPHLAALSQYLHRHLFPDTAPASKPEIKPAPQPKVDSEAIAIVGVGLRFPGGVRDLTSFAKLLFDGVEAISEVPRERWDIDALYDPDPDALGKVYTRHGAFLEGMERFDASFFGISPREAVGMDPQQRLLLEVAWEAIENAALNPEKLFGSNTGVFVGLCGSDYAHVLARQGAVNIDSYFATGTAHSVAAGRLSYVFGLNGPSMAIDTACSSSLVALHSACESLRRHECDLALTGGVNAVLTPDYTINFCRARMLAPDGHCKPFSASADGFVRGEGCGVVVLRRLSDALMAGERVLAIVRGSAVNQDGRSSGLTAPNGPSQEAVVRQALRQAGVEPADVGYVEAHGTGTSLGDPIELRALAGVLCDQRTEPVFVGSVKANLGHLEGAAGIAGVIKAMVVLQQEAIPRQLNIDEPSRQIPWNEIPIRIPNATMPWKRGSRPRIAGVSSFGLSGTNAHVVLEEPPLARIVPPPASTMHLLTVSGRSASGLAALVDRFHQFVQTRPEVALNDVCASSNLGRAHNDFRLAMVFRTRDELLAQLTAAGADREATGLHRGRIQRGLEQPATPPLSADAEAEQWLDELARHYTSWHEMDWDPWKLHFPGSKIELPTYPFQGERFWPDPPTVIDRRHSATSILGHRLRCASDDIIFETLIDPVRYPLLEEHRIHGRLIVPGAWFLSLLCEAATELIGTAPITIEDFVIAEPLVCQADRPRTLQVLLSKTETNDHRVRILSSPADDSQGTWTLHVSAKLREAANVLVDSTLVDLSSRIATMGGDTRPFYDRLAKDGVVLGSHFRVLDRFWIQAGDVLTRIRPPDAMPCRLHPCTIDSCFQTFGVGLSVREDHSLVHVLRGIERVSVIRDGIPQWCLAQLRPRVGETAEATVRLVDDVGRTLVHLEGVQLRRVEPPRAAAAAVAVGSGHIQRPGSRSPMVPLHEHVRSRLAEILRFENADKLAADDRFFEIGMDSMRAVELQITLERDLGIELPATLVFEYPTIAALSQYISRLLNHDGDGANGEVAELEPHAEDRIEDWTEAELESALQSKIDELNRGFHE